MNRDEILAREYNKYTNKIFASQKPKSLNDIKHLLRELDPKHNKDYEADLNTDIIDQGKTQKINAKATIKSKRSIILMGFDKLKSLQNQNEDEILADYVVPVNNNGASLYWFDVLLERWFGARRDGLHMVWDLGNESYIYDIYEHKLVLGKK